MTIWFLMFNARLARTYGSFREKKMSTQTERRLKELKRATEGKRDQWLVPLIEDFMQNPVAIDDDEDVEFLNRLAKARTIPREERVYSPSQFGACIRYVYFLKNDQDRVSVPSISGNGIFNDGNFRHYKWQFVLWKMHREGIILLLGEPKGWPAGSEIRVSNKEGDCQGSIDNLVYIPDRDVIVTVDYKGMASHSFTQYSNTEPPYQYMVQSVLYGLLANEDKEVSARLPQPVEYSIIIGENKSGAVSNRKMKSPLGLFEWRFPIGPTAEIDHRLALLRHYEKSREIPPPACRSTKRFQFQNCPFSYYCRGEVEEIEREQRKEKGKAESPKPRFGRI